jgi:hypothetical protein
MSLDVYLQMYVDTGGKEKHRVVLYEANITHNLTGMADACGLYKPVWRPEDIVIKTGADLIQHLRDGIKRLESAPAYYSQFDSESGWGTYNQFLPFLRGLLVACVQHPKAEYYACR